MDWTKFRLAKGRDTACYYFPNGSKIEKEINFISLEKGRYSTRISEYIYFEGGRTHTRDSDGSVHLKNALGNYDCDFGPALIEKSGSREWFKNGLRHRLNGPACESAFSTSWFVDGVMHRTDGPAYLPIQPNNLHHQPQWWVQGQRMTEAEFHESYKLAERLQSQLEEKRPAKLIKI